MRCEFRMCGETCSVDVSLDSEDLRSVCAQQNLKELLHRWPFTIAYWLVDYRGLYPQPCTTKFGSLFYLAPTDPLDSSRSIRTFTGHGTLSATDGPLGNHGRSAACRRYNGRLLRVANALSEARRSRPSGNEARQSGSSGSGVAFGLADLTLDPTQPPNRRLEPARWFWCLLVEGPAERSLVFLAVARRRSASAWPVLRSRRPRLKSSEPRAPWTRVLGLSRFSGPDEGCSRGQTLSIEDLF